MSYPVSQEAIEHILHIHLRECYVFGVMKYHCGRCLPMGLCNVHTLRPLLYLPDGILLWPSLVDTKAIVACYSGACSG
jgi:hypothetical protein